MSRKAQAAMEFLMTYGWAILVVLAAIGALAYFGVLSPEKFLPEKCTIAPGIDCAGFDVRSTSAIFSLRNGMGKDLDITMLKVGENCTASANTSNIDPPLPAEFPNADLVTFTITGCTNGDIGDRFRGDVVIRYTEEITGITKLTDGGVVGRIKE